MNRDRWWLLVDETYRPIELVRVVRIVSVFSEALMNGTERANEDGEQSTQPD